MSRMVLVLLVAMLVIGTAPWVGGPLDGPQADFILRQLRVPRVLLGVLVGSTLGLTGAAYQALFDNPLAAPSTVGTTAGAALGALAALVLLPPAVSAATPTLTAAAFAGALIVTAAITAVASSGRASTEDILLAGIALTLASGALSTGLQVQADAAATMRAVRWGLGTLSLVGYTGVVVLLPFALITHVLLLGQVSALEALVAGSDRAQSQGVDVVRTRTLVLGGGALGVAAVVAWCGPIAFVGLIVPHIVRRTLGAARRVLLPMSAVVGAAFLVGADALARGLSPGNDLPVGVLTAAIGAPTLIALVLDRR